MIARLSILLPFTLAVREGDVLPPYELDQGLFKVRIYPPCRAMLDPKDAEAASPVSLDAVLDQLVPTADQQPSELIHMDKAKTVQANLLQLDFLKADFDRRATGVGARLNPAEGDPPATLGFELANQFLQRLRSLSRAGQIKLLDPNRNLWRIEYLSDEGQVLPKDPQFIRRRFGTPVRWQVVGINADVWERLRGLYERNYSARPWETLLLDAEALLPEINPAIALASAALECFSAWYLEEIARRRGLPAGLWDWINDRGDWYKEPSIEERFHQLLLGLAGRSLQEDQDLWLAFIQLRQARNSFSHHGQAKIGKQKKTVVTPELAAQLVTKASRIINWCETLIPQELRRPDPPSGIEFSFYKQLTASPAEENAHPGPVAR